MHNLILLMVVILNSCFVFVEGEPDVILTTTAVELTKEERANLISTLNASFKKFDMVTRSLSDEQLNFRSKPKKWAIAECIEHVTLAEIHFSEIIADEMQKPSNPAYRSHIKIKDEKIRPKMLSRLWKAKSPEVYKPSGRFNNPREAITAFHIERSKTIDYIRTTQDDLRNHFWKHRLTGTIDLYQTILLMSAHLERHIEQMEGIKTHKNFPI